MLLTRFLDVLQDPAGNVQRGRRVKLVNVFDESPATIYADAEGTTPIGLPYLTTDEVGLITAYCAGEIKVVDYDSGETVRDFVQVPAQLITPYLGGGVPDGDADNIGALYEALNRAVGSGPSTSNYGKVISLASRRWSSSEPWAIDGITGLCVQDGRVRPLGSGWDGTEAVIKTAIGGARTIFQNVTVDGDRKSQWFELSGSGSRLVNCEGLHPINRGISLLGAECQISGGRYSEWTRSDAEFANDAAYQATLIYVNINDCNIDGSVIGRWAGRILHLGPDGITLSVGGAHFYNGGGGVLIRENPTLVYQERGSTVIFDRVYFDNGKLLLYGPGGVAFGSNRVLYNDNRCSIDTFIEAYATPGSASDFVMAQWQIASDDLSNGTVPFIRFLPNGEDTWDGDHTNFEASGGQKTISEGWTHSRLKTDKAPSLKLMAPGSSRLGGANIALVSAGEYGRPSDPPLVYAFEGQIYHFRAGRQPEPIPDTGDYFVTLSDSGVEKIAANAAVQAVYLPHDARPGLHVWITRGDTSAANVNVRCRTSTYPGSTFYEESNEDDVSALTAVGQTLFAICESNADGVSAKYHLRREGAPSGTGGPVVRVF